MQRTQGFRMNNNQLKHIEITATLTAKASSNYAGWAGKGTAPSWIIIPILSTSNHHSGIENEVGVEATTWKIAMAVHLTRLFVAGTPLKVPL